MKVLFVILFSASIPAFAAPTCDNVKSDVYSIVKSARSGTSFATVRARIESRRDVVGLDYTNKMINLAEGAYVSKKPLNPTDEAGEELFMCDMFGIESYVNSLKDPRHTWKESAEESKKKSEEIQRDIARMDREIAALDRASNQLAIDRAIRQKTDDLIEEQRKAEKRRRQAEEDRSVIGSRPSSPIIINCSHSPFAGGTSTCMAY